ncbi:MAG TPA: mucoidy inhibitor MuiA family protein, partial [Bacteroidales bacterium]|nr:mucoidy inhibitor MuiA family protein [Bacteroidales bacterium]
MRTIVLFIAFLGLSTVSAQTPKQVDSKISDVVVYLRGAQITRHASVAIPAGKSDILFTGLTARLNSNSLQVSTEKGVTILSVNHAIDHLQQANTDARIEKLMKRHDNLEDSIELIKNTREVSLKEREMLLSNQYIGGQESGVNVEQLIRATNFFRERLTDIEKSMFSMQKKIDDMQERLNKLNRQLNELNAKKNMPSSTVKIAIAANNRQSTRINLTYTVDQARWQPEYDLRVDDINDPLNLVYKAKVFQNTDEKWDNVNLTLSTGNPSISNNKPQLQPWFLDFIKPRPLKSFDMNEQAMELSGARVMDDKKERPKMAKGTAALGRENVTTTQQQTTTAFQINIPYTIPSDNKGYDVAVTDHQLDA